jgi:hypothetical protein
MRRTATCNIWTALVLFFFLTIQHGCGSNRAAPTIPINRSRAEQSVVRPAFGLKTCFLGMRFGELGEEWTKGNQNGVDAKFFKDYLEDRKAGLAIRHDGKQIKSIFVYYRSDDFEPFSGEIEGGIGASSSIEDVIRAIGQPLTISIRNGSRTDEHPGAKYTYLQYLQKGIDFEFVDGKLCDARIYQPVTDYRRELQQDMGDTRAYRAIVPN